MSEKTQNCKWCGMQHERTVCPMVKAIEYHSDGSTKRVEFKTGTDYPVTQWTTPWNPNTSSVSGF